MKVPKVSDQGLSPRLRGNRRPAGERTAGRGTIPAPAGKPTGSAPVACAARDYPRACGETLARPASPGRRVGLSPRLRGNPCLPGAQRHQIGTIPAPAGKPTWPRPRTPSAGDYPRACGETMNTILHLSRQAGLSPRLRGNPAPGRRRAIRRGTIPAPAGKPGERRPPVSIWRDYPRACGETGPGKSHRKGITGLSPRLRGNPMPGAAGSRVLGTIPAPAGKPPGPGTSAG